MVVFQTRRCYDAHFANLMILIPDTYIFNAQ